MSQFPKYHLSTIKHKNSTIEALMMTTREQENDIPEQVKFIRLSNMSSLKSYFSDKIISNQQNQNVMRHILVNVNSKMKTTTDDT